MHAAAAAVVVVVVVVVAWLFIIWQISRMETLKS